MGYSYNYTPRKSFDLEIDVDKKFETEIKTQVEAKYELDVEVDKDIKIKVDIYSDVDLDDNVAVTTGLAENDSSKYLMDVTSLSFTDNYTSQVNSTATVVKNLQDPVSLGDFTTLAKGDYTYAELDMQVHVTDYSNVISWTGESATD